MSKLLEALHAFQADPPELRKDSTNPHYGNSYISLGALLSAVLPRLNKLGLVLTQEPVTLGEDRPGLRTTIVHTEAGPAEPYASLASTVPLVLERENSQGLGSALTYTKRYALISILGLDADEDDDGEAASNSAPPTSGGARF